MAKHLKYTGQITALRYRVEIYEEAERAFNDIKLLDFHIDPDVVSSNITAYSNATRIKIAKIDNPLNTVNVNQECKTRLDLYITDLLTVQICLNPEISLGKSINAPCISEHSFFSSTVSVITHYLNNGAGEWLVKIIICVKNN